MNKIKFIPNYAIETGEARRLMAWLIERSVFFLHGVDWAYVMVDPSSLWLVRN